MTAVEEGSDYNRLTRGYWKLIFVICVKRFIEEYTVFTTHLSTLSLHQSCVGQHICKYFLEAAMLASSKVVIATIVIGELQQTLTGKSVASPL